MKKQELKPLDLPMPTQTPTQRASSRIDRNLESVLPSSSLSNTPDEDEMMEEQPTPEKKVNRKRSDNMAVRTGAVSKSNMSEYSVPIYPKIGPDQLKILQQSGMGIDEFINDAIMNKAGTDRTNDALVTGMLAQKGVNTEQTQTSAPRTGAFGRLKEQMAEMMEMTMMERMMDKMFTGKRDEAPKEDLMEKILKMKQLQMLMNDDSVGEKGKEKLGEMLKNEIDSLRKDIDDKNKWKDIVDELKGNKSDGKIGLVDILKIQGDNSTKIETMRAEAERERSENIKLNNQMQIDKLTDLVQGQRTQNDPSRFEELAQTLKSVKDISNQLTGVEKTPSKLDSLQAILASAMPIIKPLAEAAGEGMKNDMYNRQMQQQPQQMPTMNPQPMEMPQMPQQQPQNQSGYKFINVS